MNQKGVLHFLLYHVQVLAAFCGYIPAFDDSIIFHINWPGPKLDPEIKLKDLSGDILPMVSANKEKYHCFLPSGLDHREKNRKSQYQGPSPLELLMPLFSQITCSYRLEQYWTYELCHGRFARQFHEDNTVQGKVRQEYYLGKYDPTMLDDEELSKKIHAEEDNAEKTMKNPPSIRIDGNEHPSFAINMSDGTICNLNGRPRFTQVLYVCHEDGKHEIYSLKETSTCEYEIVILSPLLCDHPSYRSKSQPQRDIYCHSIDTAPAKPKRLTSLEKETGSAESSEPNIRSVDPSSVADESHATINPIIPKPVSVPRDRKLIEDLLQGIYCLRGGTGWWKYEFCYGKKVEQYHEDSRTGMKTTILLGVWKAEKHLAWLSRYPNKKPKKAPLKQISLLYTDGDFCDETGKYRQVEVKLKCKEISGHPNSVTLYLLEPKTCEYVLSVESPILCPLLESVDDDGIPNKSFNT